MIKICHMTSAHGPEDVRIFHKECVSLSKAGYDVTLIECGDSYEKDGVHIVGFGQASGGRLKRMLFISRRVYKMALEVDADIYHFHDPELLPYGLKLKKAGKQVIFDSHEHTAEAILEKEWLPSAIQNVTYQWYCRYQWRVCAKLDAVITVSPHIMRYFQKINPNTVEIRNYPQLKSVRLPEFSEKVLVFAGGVSSLWLHHEILQAMEQLPDCEYILCGGGEEAYINRLKSLPAWKRVRFMGRISHAKVAEQLAKGYAGMAVTPYVRNSDYKNGTMGNTKIFEEMMAGLPVICTNFVLWKEFVDRYHCGICVDPNNLDEITDAIRYLLDHPEEARQMGENGRRAIEEEFNWGEEEKKLLSLYEDILNER